RREAYPRQAPIASRMTGQAPGSDGAQQDRFAQRCQTLDGCRAKPGITKVPGAVGSSQWRPHLLSESATRGLVYLSGKLRSGSLWSPDTPYAIYYERTRA